MFFNPFTEQNREREREREREGDRGRLTPTCNKDSLNTGNILEKSTFYLLSKRLYHSLAAELLAVITPYTARWDGKIVKPCCMEIIFIFKGYATNRRVTMSTLLRTETFRK